MDGSIKKQCVFEGNAGVRKKETSVHRRERRLRAEMRTYTHILKAAQAAAVHHSSSSTLVHHTAEFQARSKRPTEAQSVGFQPTPPAASTAASVVAADVASFGFICGQEGCAYTAAAAAGNP